MQTNSLDQDVWQFSVGGAELNCFYCLLKSLYGPQKVLSFAYKD